jgi:hypothetical protein
LAQMKRNRKVVTVNNGLLGGGFGLILLGYVGAVRNGEGSAI